jgi:hypothetical protein
MSALACWLIFSQPGFSQLSQLTLAELAKKKTLIIIYKKRKIH